MKIHALIFCSIFFIINTSHSMEIIKKDDNSHEFFFTDFAKNFTHMKEWDYFKIPTQYQSTLSPTQVNFLEKLFKTQPLKITPFTYGQPQPIALLYILRSEQDCRQFLTLPIKIRECLITGNMKIGIKKRSGGSCLCGPPPHNCIQLKPMIPEDINYKCPYTKIIFHHQKDDIHYFCPLV